MSGVLGALTLGTDTLGPTGSAEPIAPTVYKDSAYLGSGVFYLGPADGSGPLLDVGNSTELSLTHQWDSRPLANYRSGGQLSTTGRLLSVGIKWIVSDRNMANLLTALRATASTGTVSGVDNEPHTAWRGGFIPLDHMPNNAAPLSVAGYVEGDDYLRTIGGIVIISDGSIDDATDLLISYTRAGAWSAQAFAGEQNPVFRASFAGLNDADNQPTRIDIPRLSLNPADLLTIIDTTAEGLSMAGNILADLSAPAGRSPFYTVHSQS